MHPIRYHLANPDITIEAHIARRSQELNSDLADRIPIYLDLRFWVVAREVREGVCNDPLKQRLVKHLERLADQGRVFCPISETVFFELMKIGDDVRRKTTLDVIDELSMGVSLLPWAERAEVEFEVMLQSETPLSGKSQTSVWTRLAYTMGNFKVTDARFPPETMLAIQKAFFDHLWELPLASLAESLDPTEVGMTHEMANAAAKLNEANRAHQSEMVSFDSVLSDEFRGVAQFVEPMFGQVLDRLGIVGSETIPSESDRQMMVNLVHSILCSEHRKKLPTIHVYACLHALFRWDYRNKTITPNDLFDFGHATAALGYCDAFFTEEGVTRAVTHQRLNLDEQHHCVVTNRVEAALNFLRSLS